MNKKEKKVATQNPLNRNEHAKWLLECSSTSHQKKKPSFQTPHQSASTAFAGKSLEHLWQTSRHGFQELRKECELFLVDLKQVCVVIPRDLTA